MQNPLRTTLEDGARFELVVNGPSVPPAEMSHEWWSKSSDTSAALLLQMAKNSAYRPNPHI